MLIRVIGFNHKSASLAVRERAALTTDQSCALLQELKGRFSQGGFVFLSTCNRVELYVVCPADAAPSQAELWQCWEKAGQVLEQDYPRDGYCYDGAPAVRHLFEVASSLDSMVIGESQIIGQVKASYRRSCQLKVTNKVLNRLFHSAFSTSKEIYTQTSVTRRRVSIAGMAVELAREIFAEFSKITVNVIGTGEMGELLLRHFLDLGCRDIIVTSRHCPRSQSVAQRYGVRAGDWSRLAEQIADSDLTITASSGNGYLLDKAALEAIAVQRGQRPLMLIDIAVPRNLDPAIAAMPQVVLYSIDELAVKVQENIAARQEDVDAAQSLIERNIRGFVDWLMIMELGPLLGQFKQQYQSLTPRQIMTMLEEHDVSVADCSSGKAVVHELIQHFSELARVRGVSYACTLLEKALQSA